MGDNFCSIPGCEKKAAARGWCGAHWKRWRKYGSPTAGGTHKGALASFLVTAIQHTDRMECLIWPFSGSGNGYGKLEVNGRREFAHRVVCERMHGPAPSTQHYAAHACGKGHLGCVNPHHLSWKTPKENSADQKMHGTTNRGDRNGAAKLSPAEVLEIRSLSGSITQAELGVRFGISRSAVSDIQSHRRWAWLHSQPEKAILI